MCISGPPADGTHLHVSFYPGPRLMARFACNVLSGSPAHGTLLQKIYIRIPADGSQRVKMRRKCLADIISRSAIFSCV